MKQRFDNIRQMAGLSVDGKTIPPKEDWLDDDALESWQSNQELLKKQSYGRD